MKGVVNQANEQQESLIKITTTMIVLEETEFELEEKADVTLAQVLAYGNF